VRAAASAARGLGRPFVFCARADGVMNGVYDTDEAIRRVRAFEAAGADLLYVPLPPDMASLKRIVDSVTKPVNALAAGPFARHSVEEFAAIGVRRISVGSAIARATHRVIAETVSAMLDKGDFTPLANGMKGVDAMLIKGANDAS